MGLVIFATLGAAIGVAALQLFIKGLSRWRRLLNNALSLRDNLKGLFEADDFMFWHEWIIAADAALVFFVTQTAIAQKLIPVETILTLVGLLVVGLSFVPLAMGGVVYTGAGVQPEWKSVTLANIIGLLFLVAAVAVGAQIYG